MPLCPFIKSRAGRTLTRTLDSSTSPLECTFSKTVLGVSVATSGGVYVIATEVFGQSQEACNKPDTMLCCGPCSTDTLTVTGSL